MNFSSKEECLERLLDSYSAYFDIVRDVKAEEITFDAAAAFHSRSERYVLVKKAQIWAAEMNEYVYFSVVDTLDLETFIKLYKKALSNGLEQIKPHKEHMYSYVTLIVLTDNVTEEAAKEIRRVNYHKNYLLSFHGWMEFHTAVIQCSTGDIISNKQGKALVKSFNKLLN